MNIYLHIMYKKFAKTAFSTFWADNPCLPANADYFKIAKYRPIYHAG